MKVFFYQFSVPTEWLKFETVCSKVKLTEWDVSLKHVDHRLSGNVFQIRVTTARGCWQSLLAGEIADEIATIHKRVELIDRVLLWHVEVVDGLVTPSDIA